MTQHDLDSVREDLKRLGYLDPGLERYFLQDALRERTPFRSLLRLTLRDTLLAAPILALLSALTLAVVNGNLSRTPFDVAPLSLHLLPLAALAAFAGFLVLGVAMVPLMRARPRSAETWSLALSAAGVGAPLLAAGWAMRSALAEAPRSVLALEALAGAGLVYALGKVVATGLFAWAIELAERVPRRRWLGRRFWAALAVGAALLALAPLFLVASASRLEVAPTLPTRPGGSVALIGIDGVRSDELRYLLSSGELPALAAALGEGGALDAYVRGPEAPASFWTAVATGLPTPEHGVVSLDAFLPRGVRTSLAVNGPLRGYWTLGERLGWVAHRATLSDRREAFTFWELAARGGDPVVAIGWWATYPATDLPGLVVAHGAYSLLGAAAGGADPGRVVAPDARRDEVEALRDPTSAGQFAVTLRAARRAAEADAVLERSFLPDAFAWRVAEIAVGESTRALALYLPGVDIAADALGDDPALPDLVRRQLIDLDRRVGWLQKRFGTVAVVIDPGRRPRSRRSLEEGVEGSVLWLRKSDCRTVESSRASVSSIAAGLMRDLGLPQSAQLGEPSTSCSWPEPPARLPTLGIRGAGAATDGGEEYLRSLRALGYL